MDKNITIPFSLLSRIIELLDYWNVDEYCYSIQQDYSDVMFALTKKKQSIELREAYARIIYAEDDDARHEARMRYLQQKRELNEPF